LTKLNNKIREELEKNWRVSNLFSQKRVGEAIFNKHYDELKRCADQINSRFLRKVWVDSSDFEGHCGHIYKEPVVANISIKAFGQKRYKVPFHKGVVDL